VLEVTRILAIASILLGVKSVSVGISSSLWGLSQQIVGERKQSVMKAILTMIEERAKGAAANHCARP